MASLQLLHINRLQPDCAGCNSASLIAVGRVHRRAGDDRNILPANDAVFATLEMLPVADDLARRLVTCERQQRMEMLGHQ